MINQYGINVTPIGSDAISTLQFIGRHRESGLARLIEQFKNKEDIVKLLKMFLDELDEVEVAYYETIRQRTISQAEGTQLDSLGTTLGQPREGLDDAAYRKRLKLQTAINTSKGEPDRVLSVWKTLTGAEEVSLVESFPAQLELTADNTTATVSIMDEMHRVLPAAVALVYTITNGTPFSFFDGNGLGFGTTDDPGVGGTFISRAT